MAVDIAREPGLDAQAFAGLLHRSGLAARRPADDIARLGRILASSQLVLTARDGQGGALVGVARAITDWDYCLYCADLAVDRDWQGQGIGKALLARLVAESPGVKSHLLLSAPAAVGFYEKAGCSRHPAAFLFTDLGRDPRG